jgi:hypothetical protein
MLKRVVQGALAILVVCVVSGCGHTGGTGSRYIPPTNLHLASKQLEEAELLDVAVVMFESKDLTTKEQEEQGLDPAIQAAEGHFVPHHLAATMERSGYWGAVRTVPEDSETTDVRVLGTILRSNGEYFSVEVRALDSTNREWFNRRYHSRAKKLTYPEAVSGSKDPFQDLYNTIANDLASYRRTLTASDLKKVRDVSKLRFASKVAPDQFGEYLGTDELGKIKVLHLPADNDPAMARVERLRERDFMFNDTVHNYYDAYYTKMWDSYKDWREAIYTEALAVRKVKRDSVGKAIIGAALIAGAVAVADQSTAGAVALGLAGASQIGSSVQLRKQVKMHKVALKELSESFSKEMSPVVIEFEGKQYELKGTAEEQSEKWQQILRRIYQEETGFGTDGDAK